jgi:hypothetical protein
MRECCARTPAFGGRSSSTRLAPGGETGKPVRARRCARECGPPQSLVLGPRNPALVAGVCRFVWKNPAPARGAHSTEARLLPIRLEAKGSPPRRIF